MRCGPWRSDGARRRFQAIAGRTARSAAARAQPRAVRRPADGLVHRARVARRALPATGLAALPGRRLRPSGHAHRQRQDARRPRRSAARSAPARRCTGAEAARRTGGIPPAPALDHAAVRPRRRHRARDPRAGGGARDPVDRRHAHRRRQRARPPPGAPRPGRGAGHHARILRTGPVLSRRRGPAARGARGDRGRMARVAGQQARRAAAAVPGAAARGRARGADLGPVGHLGQPRGSARRAAARPARCPHPCRSEATASDARNPDPRRGRALPLGRPPRTVAARARGRGASACAQQPAVHQHPLAGRTLAPGAAGGVAG